ncbi:HAD family phosphatase [Candidatus Saccharibacteria bacterium]|nr:HAD family phosphatase [Candidatus Saccharibacteria bacterium]MBI3338488.1 HAD family phosphatase [Candidatus Saccharibacteria bacterium]
MIKAIIFDCFGVLVGSGFKETYRQAGGDPVKDGDFINDLLGMANLGVISTEEMNKQITEKIGITHEKWRVSVLESELLHKELMTYIQELKKKYKVAILSNANTGTLDRKFTPEQLAIFDAVVVSAEVGMIKPDPKIYEYTANKLGLKPRECVFIDDIKVYCEAARMVGMKAIFYNDFKQFQRELIKILTPDSNN